MVKLRSVAIFLLVASVAGCQLVIDLGDKQFVDSALEGGAGTDAPGTTDPDSSSTEDAAATEAGGDAAPQSCPTGTKGATMVALPNPNGGVTCIDATEVTRDQYAAFLAATSNGTDVAGQPPECVWNPNYRPDNNCLTYPYPDPFVCTGANCGIHPQVCINWCSAFMYCKWAGKRLCGSIAGGKLSPDKTFDAKVSQWTNACTTGGKYTYPYGDAFVKQRCQTYAIADNGRTTAAVGGHPDCQSKDTPFKGVFDLSGNVSEWEDSCIAGANPIDDQCFVRGGGFLDETKTRCDSQLKAMRARAEPDFGFRCCGP